MTIASEEGKMFEFIENRDLLGLIMLIEQNRNIDIDAQNQDGITGLHIAVLQENLCLAYYLLKKGADPDLNISGEDSPLEIAEENQDIHMVRLIKQYKADPKKISDSITHFVNDLEEFAIKTLHPPKKDKAPKIAKKFDLPPSDAEIDEQRKFADDLLNSLKKGARP